MESGTPVRDLEVRGTTAAHPGVERTWLANYFPFKANDGSIVGLNVVVLDITERKQTETA